MSAYRIARLSSVVRPSSTFSNVFFSETTGPIEAKFHVEPPWDRERKLVRGVQVTRPRWPPCLYMVKTLQNSSPEPVSRLSRSLVCFIGNVEVNLYVNCKLVCKLWHFVTSVTNARTHVTQWQNATCPTLASGRRGHTKHQNYRLNTVGSSSHWQIFSQGPGVIPNIKHKIFDSYQDYTDGLTLCKLVSW